MKFILKIIISALAIIVSSLLLPGVEISSAWNALVVAAVLSFLNAIVKPIMIILTIPITIFTLGLFLVVINALMILLAAYLVDGFSVNGFWYALLFSIVLSLTTTVFEKLAGESDNKRKED
jgi:putative membrane protein